MSDVWDEDKEGKKQQEADFAASKQEKVNKDEMVKEMLNRREGRDYLSWLFTITGLDHTAFTNNALSTAFNCGKQDVGREIMAHLMEVSPYGYLKMMKENSNGD